MAITPQQKQVAQVKQHAAAHDKSFQVRLIAGPGTGKSFAIEERVCWLLSNGHPPSSIYVVSFTRAAALDLRQRVQKYCSDHAQPDGALVSVSTLHSLALRILRRAHLLSYPADPLVLDNWEQDNVFDIEFSVASGHKPGHANVGFTPGRCEEIRRDHEAFWSTSQWLPPNYIAPVPPVSSIERTAFTNFHGPRTQTYSCVLPGEIVRQCLMHIMAGTLDPVALLGIQHLIVDEFQDLNPADLEFVDQMISRRAVAFVAGDDDQSLYSFRFASPSGIQCFKARYPHSATHELTDCFRCTPSILAAASSLIAAHSDLNRIPKFIRSLYEQAVPPVAGIMHRWHFQSAGAETRAIAESCRDLIASGLPPREILVLVSSKRTLLGDLTAALDQIHVAHESPLAAALTDTRCGRLLLALLRIVCNPQDYVAHRLVLGLRPHIGPATCDSIAQSVISNNLNYVALFYQPLPSGVFNGRQVPALSHACTTCAQLAGWQPTDTLSQRMKDLISLIAGVFGQNDANACQATIANLPLDTTLEETLNYIWADTDEQQIRVLETIYDRLGLQKPPSGLAAPKVRIMTMHGAKGLSARAVFIPGLEENILPGSKRQPIPGLVLEAARMLYVSISRARAMCVLSYADNRMFQGQPSNQVPCRFLVNVAGPFQHRRFGLSPSEIAGLQLACADL